MLRVTMVEPPRSSVGPSMTATRPPPTLVAWPLQTPSAGGTADGRRRSGRKGDEALTTTTTGVFAAPSGCDDALPHAAVAPHESAALDHAIHPRAVFPTRATHYTRVAHVCAA